MSTATVLHLASKTQVCICLLNAQNHLIRTHTLQEPEYKASVVEALDILQSAMERVALNDLLTSGDVRL